MFFHTLGIAVKTPDIIKLTPEQADSLFAEVRGCNLPEECKNVIISAIQSLLWISSAYQEKKHQLFRFMRNIFGAKTEKTNPKKKPLNDNSQKGNGALANNGQASNGNTEDNGATLGTIGNVCEGQEPDIPPPYYGKWSQMWQIQRYRFILNFVKKLQKLKSFWLMIHT